MDMCSWHLPLPAMEFLGKRIRPPREPPPPWMSSSPPTPLPLLRLLLLSGPLILPQPLPHSSLMETQALSPSTSSTSLMADLGLTIGTDVQAFDTELRDLASTTPTAGDLLTSDGTDWVEFPVGTNGLVLMASSTASNGVSWEADQTSSGASTTLDVIITSNASSTIEIASSVWTIDSAAASSTFVIDGDSGIVTINQLDLTSSTTLMADLG